MTLDYYQATIDHLGWTARAEQVELVRQLRAVIAAPETGHAVVQAGTGTGKTLAVLATAAEIGQPGKPALVLIVTNNLARQYTGRDAAAVTAATGAKIARVVGASNYVCASSRAGVLADLPQESEDSEYENRQLREVRDQWLNEQCADAPWATQWERQAHHDDDYQCPGFPECEGGKIGGCGKRYARERGIAEADVVISNYHLAAIQTMLPDLSLLPHPALVVVDEAHAFPDVICDILSGALTPGFGRRSDPTVVDEMLTSGQNVTMSRLIDWAQRLRESVTERARWREGDRWHTEQRVALLSPETAETVGKAVGVLEGILRDANPDAAEQAASDGLTTAGVLRMIVQSATDRAIVPVIYRPPLDPEERISDDARPDSIYLRRADASEFIAEMLGPRAALVSGTVPVTLPARCGLPEVVATDVGHPFDYATQARGWLSRYDGTKGANRSVTREQRARIFTLRARQLARFIGTSPALVLCPAHADVAQVARELRQHMPHAEILTQPRYGGSEAAMRTVAEFRTTNGPRVLIGVDSLATGLDLPGELLTRVAWWSLPLGRGSTVDAQRQTMYPGRGGSAVGGIPPVGSYLDARLRTKVAQGIGRLLRTVDDHGEVLLCDRRFRDHLKGSTTLLDAHLRQIPWDWAPAVDE